MSAPAPLPWYRHFWPWFILALLGSSIAMSLTTVYIAVSDRDPEVHDTWSSDAKAVTRDDAPERLARELGLGASVVAPEGQPALRVTLHTAAAAGATLPAEISVRLVHPTLERRDLEITLVRAPDGRYEAALPFAIEGRFHLLIEGSASPPDGGAPSTWRIGDRVDVVRGRPIEIGRAPGADGIGEG